MAGIGSRFSKAGFTLPKPLIDVDGRTMIRAVVDSLNVQAKYIFIVLKEHVQNFNIDKIVREIVPTCEVVVVEEVTEGAVATILTAKQFINNDNPILIVNSDNIILWDPVDFFTEVENTYLDGSIVYFEDDNPKWSFITIQDNLITKVAEKQVISNFATSGIYYWKKGSDFVKYAEDMINNNIRVNNEFYVAPVYNLAIGDGKKIGPYQIDKEEMWGVGTPEDLNFYIENNT
jgi:dTDP-glucose pyrophosphorylase